MAATRRVLRDPSGILELRDYTIYASRFKDFLRLSLEYDAARHEVYKGFLGMFAADAGGNVSRVIHLYHFPDYNARDAARRAAAVNPCWQRYTDAARECIQQKESTILLQGPAELYKAVGANCASAFSPAARQQPGSEGPQVVYELRRYLLHPGRNGVKRVMTAFQEGLPDKVAADGVGELAFVGYADVGRLNTVYEMYRYPSAQQLIEACGRTRSAPKWQEAKQTAYELCQDFSITFLHPTAFSPWR